MFQHILYPFNLLLYRVYLGCFNVSTALKASYVVSLNLSLPLQYELLYFESVFCFYVLLYHLVGHSLFQFVGYNYLRNIIKEPFTSPSPNSAFALITLSGFCGKALQPSPHGRYCRAYHHLIIVLNYIYRKV